MVTAIRNPITLGVLRSRRSEILELAQRNRAYNVRVFGSVVRGEATTESDVDFLVNFADKASLLDHVGLIQDISDLLGVEVDVANEEGLRPYLRDRIVASAVPL